MGLYRADGSTEHNPVGRAAGARIYTEAYPEDAPVHNLVDIILGRDENHSPPQLGAAVVGLLEAAYESARTGTRQAVPS